MPLTVSRGAGDWIGYVGAGQVARGVVLLVAAWTATDRRLNPLAVVPGDRSAGTVRDSRTAQEALRSAGSTAGTLSAARTGQLIRDGLRLDGRRPLVRPVGRPAAESALQGASDMTVTASLSAAHLRWLRLRAQGLAGESATGGVAAVVRDRGGVQAQDATAAGLAVRARQPDLSAAGLVEARETSRSVVCTWAMRGTLHLVATADIDWLLPLLGPVAARRYAGRWLSLGLDDATYARAWAALRAALAHSGPLTRGEIVAALAQRDVRLQGQALPHLICRAALEGHVCIGPMHGAKPTYVLLDDWLHRASRGRRLSRERALAALARRYLAGYGPAGVDDFATWSGLPRQEARSGLQAIGTELVAVDAAGSQAWLLQTQVGWLREGPLCSPSVRLLPGYDPYLLGYRRRDLVVSAAHARLIHPGGGVLHPTLTVDGQAGGTWRWHDRPGELIVEVSPFQPLPAPVLAALEGEASAVIRYLGRAGRLSVAAPIEAARA
jgi:hypothetical protein